MDNRTAKLAAQVKAVNRANDYATRVLYPLMAEFFAPLVGQQILKVNGDFLQKIERLLPKLPYTVPLSVYRHRSDYSLAWTVKTCESVDDISCLYHEVTVYIGNLDGAVFKSMQAPYQYRSDYTVEGIQILREDFRAKRDAFEAARSALHPFGE